MLWLIAFHIIFMVAWFAGLFYLPRLFVYHAQTQDTISLNRFIVMERRLYYGIMTPAASLTLIFGLIVLIINWPSYQHARWMYAKLFLVVLLFIYHGYCGCLIARFRDQNNPFSSTFYRFFNEIPTLFLISIIILAIVRPF